jgi:CRP-like cAMP-binding protein
LRVLKARRGASGDALFNEGDRGDTLVIVLDGMLVCEVGGKEIARLGPGEVVGEMAFLDAEPRSATVRTSGVTTVLEFSRPALASLRTDAPRVAAQIFRNILSDVAQRLRDAGEKLTDAAAASPKATSDAPRASLRGLTAQQLRGHRVLADRSDEDLELLAHIATVRPFTRGGVLIEQGAFGDSCFLVLSGAVDVTRGGTKVASLAEGAIVGQLALLDRASRSATVTATSDTIALEVRADAFGNLMRANSPIALRFMEQVALAGVRQLRAATKQLAAAPERPSQAPPIGQIDDWDDPEPASAPLELAVDPRSIPR